MNFKKLFKDIKDGPNRKIVKLKMNIEEQMDNLMSFTDEDWGLYEFAKDPIGQKFTYEEKKELIEKSMDLADDIKAKLLNEYNTKDPYRISSELGLKIHKPYKPVGEAHITFAIFEEPRDIYIFMDTINKYNEYLKINKKIGSIFRKIDLEKVILAHELFHVIEMKEKDSIFTQQYRKNLWKIGPFKNDSRSIAISEFSAKIFSKRLLDIDISPYIFDFLLVHLYNVDSANQIYLDMTSFKENSNKEILNQ